MTMDVTDNRHITLRVPPHIAYNEEALKQFIAQERGIDVRTINALRIRKRSIDARQRTILSTSLSRLTSTKCRPNSTSNPSAIKM